MLATKFDTVVMADHIQHALHQAEARSIAPRGILVDSLLSLLDQGH
jgi:hypothetical protein